MAIKILGIKFKKLPAQISGNQKYKKKIEKCNENFVLETHISIHFNLQLFLQALMRQQLPGLCFLLVLDRQREFLLDPIWKSMWQRCASDDPTGIGKLNRWLIVGLGQSETLFPISL